ncbi:hypothetical protein QTP88_010703 [Uroleucon formosanum]
MTKSSSLLIKTLLSPANTYKIILMTWNFFNRPIISSSSTNLKLSERQNNEQVKDNKLITSDKHNEDPIPQSHDISHISKTDINISKDPVYWKPNNYWQENIAKSGFDQNFDIDFKLSGRMYTKTKRYCSKQFFFKTTVNDEQILRKCECKECPKYLFKTKVRFADELKNATTSEIVPNVFRILCTLHPFIKELFSAAFPKVCSAEP